MKLKISGIPVLLVVLIVCQLATSSPREDKNSKESDESESDESSSSAETISIKHHKSDRNEKSDESFLSWILPALETFSIPSAKTLEKSRINKNKFYKTTFASKKKSSSSESSESSESESKESSEYIGGRHQYKGSRKSDAIKALRKSNYGRKSKGGKKSSSESSSSESNSKDSKSESSSESSSSESDSKDSKSESSSESESSESIFSSKNKQKSNRFKNAKSKDHQRKEFGSNREAALSDKSNFKITPQYIAKKFLKYRTDLKNKLDQVLPHCPYLEVGSILTSWGKMFAKSWPNFTEMAKKSLSYANELKSQLLSCLQGILKTTTKGLKNIFVKRSITDSQNKVDANGGDEEAFKEKREAVIDAGTFQENFNKEYITPVVDYFQKLPELIQAINSGTDNKRR